MKKNYHWVKCSPYHWVKYPNGKSQEDSIREIAELIIEEEMEKELDAQQAASEEALYS